MRIALMGIAVALTVALILCALEFRQIQRLQLAVQQLKDQQQFFVTDRQLRTMTEDTAKHFRTTDQVAGFTAGLALQICQGPGSSYFPRQCGWYEANLTNTLRDSGYPNLGSLILGTK